MSEQNGIQLPTEPSFDNMAFQGSLQQLLQDNLGSPVTVDFLIGSGGMTSRKGVLYAVGTSYLVLFDPQSAQYTVGDLYAVKFVTFAAPEQAGQAAAPAAPYAQAAYAHLRQQGRRDAQRT